MIDTPIRPQLEHLPVPSRWPSAQCFDLKENQSAPREWSIIIPCFQNTEYLPVLISHIARLDYDLNQIEVLIVDDGSEIELVDSIKDLARNHAELSLKVVRKERKDPETAKIDSSFRAGLARNSGFDFRPDKTFYLLILTLCCQATICMNSSGLYRLRMWFRVFGECSKKRSLTQILMLQRCVPPLMFIQKRTTGKHSNPPRTGPVFLPLGSMFAPINLAMRRGVAKGPVLFRLSFVNMALRTPSLGIEK